MTLNPFKLYAGTAAGASGPSGDLVGEHEYGGDAEVTDQMQGNVGITCSSCDASNVESESMVW